MQNEIAVVWATIKFDEQLKAWSSFTFWVVVVSVIVTLGFTVVVFIGGLGDLRYLLKSLNEPRESEGTGGSGDDLDGEGR